MLRLAMAGIAGYLRLDDREGERSTLVRQTEVLSRRGPDDGALFSQRRIGLGYRRHAREAPFPVYDAERRLALVFDGAPDGLEELRAAVGRSAPDPSEGLGGLILSAYRALGDGFVDQLRGGFALALWDEAGPHLLVARDRLGLKPLYFHVDRSRFAFASEVEALLVDPAVPRVVDPGPVAHWFHFGLVPEPSTFVRDVYAVRPGEVLVVGPSRLRRRRIWTVGRVTGGSGLSALRSRLADAAGRGEGVVALSGGPVSGAMAAWRSKTLWTEALTVAGLHPADVVQGRLLAAELGLSHHVVELRAQPKSVFDEAFRWMDLPIGDPRFVDHVGVAMAAPRDDRPLLFGHGATALGRSSARVVGIPAALSPRFAAGPARSTWEPPVEQRVAEAARIVDRLAVAGRPTVAALLDPASLESAAALGDPDFGQIARGEVPPGSLELRDRSPVLAEWMRGLVNERMERALFAVPGGSSGLLDDRCLRRWWYLHQLRLADRTVGLWRAAAFDQWFAANLGQGRERPERRRGRRFPGGEGARPVR